MAERKKQQGNPDVSEMPEARGANDMPIGNKVGVNPMTDMPGREMASGNAAETDKMPEGEMSQAGLELMSEMPGGSSMIAELGTMIEMPGEGITTGELPGIMGEMPHDETMIAEFGIVNEMPYGAPMETETAGEAQLIEISGEWRLTFWLTSLKRHSGP